MKLSKIILTSLILIMIIAGSELNYIVNNKPILVSIYYLWISKNITTISPVLSIKYINHSAKYAALTNTELTEGKIQVYEGFHSDLNSIDSGFLLEYQNILQNINFSEISQKPYTIAKTYYSLALVAKKNKEWELTRDLLEAAVYSDPELSYYAVELANFYLTSANPKKGKETLENCYKFRPPQKHCQEYADNNLYLNTPFRIGSFENLILKSHQY